MKTNSRFLACGLGLAALFTLPACAPKSALPEAPDAAMQKIVSELSTGQAGILWTAMPASYRTDLTAIANEAGSKLDAELYDRGFGLVGRIATVLDKQRGFILAGQLSSQVQDKAALEANWDSLVAFLNTIATSQLASAKGLQTLDLKKLFETTGSQLLGHAQKLSQASEKGALFDQLKAMKFELEKREGDTASLRVTQPDGKVTSTAMTKVENRWVPAEMAAEWTQKMTEARAKLAEVKPEDMTKNKPQILGALAMAEGVLDQLGAAKTQAEFDQALQGAMMPLMGLMMMGSSLK